MTNCTWLSVCVDTTTYIYSECIFQEITDEIDIGININGENINSVRYADEILVLADSYEHLHDNNNWDGRYYPNTLTLT